MIKNISFAATLLMAITPHTPPHALTTHPPED
jgi:hypothetical protein